MIRIIQPSQYKAVGGEDKQNNKSQSSFQLQEQSEDDSDIEIQVVNTEQKGNEIVYKISNYALILFAIFIILVYYIEIHHSQTIILNNIEHIQTATMYSTQIQGQKVQVTMFLPHKNIQQSSQIKQTAEFCLKYQVNDCSRQILMHKKYLFIQIQQWLMSNIHLNQRNVLIFWEERLSLAILLINLNREQKIWIDIIINQQDSPIYIQCFKFNLQRYGLQNYIRIMRQIQLSSNLLKGYSLVVGNNQILDKIIYPEILQKAVLQGMQQKTSELVYNFISHTNLLIYYHQPHNQSRVILQQLQNQVTLIKTNQKLEIQEYIVKDFNQTLGLVLLDRKKYIPKQKDEGKQTNNNQPQQQNEGVILLQPKQLPLLQIRRIQPQKIINFFRCSQSNRFETSLGSYYKSQFRDLLIKKITVNEQNQSHIYNFIYHYFQSNPCNTLYIIDNPIIANIVASVNVGQLYLPNNINQNLVNFQKDFKVNHQIKNYHLVTLEKSYFQTFIYDSQIGVIFITQQLFVQWFQKLIWALKQNINILVKFEGDRSKLNLTKITTNFYIFAIFQGKIRQFDQKCIKDYDAEYFQNKQYPKSTYLLISITNIFIQEVNPSFYNANKLERRFRHKKYKCYRNFDLVKPVENSNLQKQQVILMVNNKISLILESESILKQIVDKIKSQQPMILFLKNSLIVSDNILIYSQKQPSIFLLLNIMTSLTQGQTYFINFNQNQIANIQRHVQINYLKAIYQYTNQVVSNLQTFVANHKISTLFLSPQTIKESHSIIPKMKKGSMMFFNYQKKDYQLQQILQKYLSDVKLYQIISRPAEESTNNLCLNYQINEINHFVGLADNSWIIMIIKSFY